LRLSPSVFTGTQFVLRWLGDDEKEVSALLSPKE
jgi:hypothetical protein